MVTKRDLLKAALTGAVCAPSLARAAAAGAGPRAGYFPNTVVQTQHGQKLRFYDDVVKGNKIVVFNMIYTMCTNICPPSTANLSQVQELLGDRVGRDIFFYSLTLRPEADTPQALLAYARQFGLKPGWTLLTGKPKEMDLIRRKLGFYDRDPEVDKDLSQHTGMVRIGKEAYDRWTMMPALLTPRQLVDSITRL